MRKFLLAALFFCLISTFALSQGFRIGLSTGLNTNVVLDEGLKSDPRYQATNNYTINPIGLNVTYEITPYFGLSLESILSHQETIYEIIDVAQTVKGQHELDMRYVNLPLLFKFMSGGEAATRFNFNLGPQMSILTKAQENFSADAGIYQIPENASFEDIRASYPEATQTSEQAQEGTYSLPDDISRELLQEDTEVFKNLDFQIALGMGLTFDVARHFMITTQFRANYSIDGFRNQDVFNAIANGSGELIFAEKANLALGFQLGLHYSFNVTRAFKRKQGAVTE